MSQRSRWTGILVILPALLVGLSGCSSLPRNPLQESATGRRTYSLHELGSKHLQAGQTAKACVFFERALALHAAVDDQAGVARALASLGRCRLALGHLDQAQADFGNALEAIQGLPSPQLAGQAMAGLGEVALHRQDPREARSWFEKGLRLPLADPGLERAILLHDLGAAMLALGDLAAAQIHVDQALAMNTRLRNPLGVATSCYSLAIMQVKQGDLDEAAKLARRALQNDKKAENPPGIAQDLSLLATVSLAQGKTEAGRDYYRRAQLVWQSMGRPEKT
nr:tetratricopeptide repeat protein [Candidatus Krumholzibacteria bacterium]